MKRKFRILIVGLILLVMMCIQISYAIDNTEEESFFSVNMTEISQGETLEMIIDLTQIEYEQFEIRISSDIEVEDVYTDEDLSEEVEVEVEEEEEEDEEKNITITIDKNSLDAEQISLYYQIPENMEIGTVITFKAVLVYEEEETTVKVEVTIVESAENDENTEQKNNESQENNESQDEMNNKTYEGNSTNESSQSSNKQTVSMSSSTVSSSTTAKTETVTYNGSNNNYLESLEIDGVELTTEFNKDRLTYFANVEDVTEITVTATPEDDTAKVSITGTDDLKEGENKILISVTAENGDVRYYRIYVVLESAE